MANQTPAASPPVMPFKVTAADSILIATHPLPIWAIPEYLPVGLAILGGRPKTGKSWLALQIAHAVAAGGIVLGQQVTPGRVLYLALEDSPRRIQGRMRAQGWKRGLLVDFKHIGEMSDIGALHLGGSQKIEEAIKAGGYRFVVIDTFRRATPGLNLKNPNEFDAALQPLQAASHDTDSAIMIVDHLRKPSATTTGNVVDDILDSTAKTATPDTIWGLYREQGKAGAKLQITGKDIEEKTLALRFETSNRQWQCQGDAENILTPVQTDLLKIVQDIGPATATQVQRQIGGDLSNVLKQLKELVGKGKISLDANSKEYQLVPDDIWN